MRRTELIAGVQELLTAIKDANLEETLQGILNITQENRTSKENISPNTTAIALESAQIYQIKAISFSDSARRLVQEFNLEILEDHMAWAIFLLQPQDARDELTKVLIRLEFIQNYLPKIAHLMRSTTLEEFEEGIKTKRPEYVDKEILTIILIEDDENPSTPTRVNMMLEGINVLYQTCTTIIQAPISELRIIACDSGSDQTFDLLGLAKVIDCVKELILSMWDRIVFYREYQFSERVKIIAETLPVLQQIAELEAANQLEPEDAARLKHNLLLGTNKFLLSKAIISEMEDKGRVTYDPRQLIAPKQKLLSAHTKLGTVTDVNKDTKSPSNFTAKINKPRPSKIRPRRL
jgi:hypothetical protein